MNRTFLKILLTTFITLSCAGNADQGSYEPELPYQETRSESKKAEPITSFYEYNNRMAVFSPLHLLYERTKPNSIYAGFDTWVSVLNREVLEAEFRMGYNYFYNGRDHITPVVGIGVFDVEHHHGTLLYGTVGLMYDHEFDRLFNMGVNFKALIGGPVNHSRSWGSPVGGFDVSLPITFRFGYHRRWDFRLEPFNIFLSGTHYSHNFFGFRNSIGFRF